MIALLIDIYALIIWLIFFKFKLLPFTLPAKIASGVIGIVMCVGILIVVNFLHPQSMDARVFQHVLPLAVNTPKSGIVTEVVVQPNVAVKQGDVLFRIDPQPYELEVARLEAALEQAIQNVPQLQATLTGATADVERLTNQLAFAQIEYDRNKKLAEAEAATREKFDEATRNLNIAQASLRQAQAQQERARLAANANLPSGENVEVAQLRAQLSTAKYNLQQTTVRAPMDGMVVNLQLQRGIVVGPGQPVLTFVANPEGIVVVTMPQEYLANIASGDDVEVALDMYPGQMLKGKVDSVVWATGQGELTPSGEIPSVTQKEAAGRFGIKVIIDEADQSTHRLPAGAAGAAAIYTQHGKPFAIVRKVMIRWYTWLNYISLAM